MIDKRIIRWVASGLLLFLGLCGIATVITNATNPTINLDTQTLQVAWTFGIGGLILFVLSLFIRSGKK